jgi:dienelactone hydrolase
VLDDLMQLQLSTGVQRVASVDEWRQRRQQIVGAFDSIIGQPPTAKPSLAPKVNEEHDDGAYVRYHISYSVDDAERVPAWLLVPKRLERPAAAILCLHGTTDTAKDELVGLAGDRHMAFAQELTRRGYITLAPDHLAAGERRPTGQRAYDTSEFYARYPEWSAVGKAIWDGQRALDYLCTRPEVDPARLGVIGHSLGGHGAVFVAGADDRVRCAVSSCGITVLARDALRLDWARDDWYIYLPRLRPIFLNGLHAPFDFHHLVALIAPRAFLNLTALNDPENFTVQATNAVAELGFRVSDVYALLGAADHFANYLHSNGHSFQREARALAYAWLDRWLKPEGPDTTRSEHDY